MLRTEAEKMGAKECRSEIEGVRKQVGLIYMKKALEMLCSASSLTVESKGLLLKLGIPGTGARGVIPCCSTQQGMTKVCEAFVSDMVVRLHWKRNADIDLRGDYEDHQ